MADHNEVLDQVQGIIDQGEVEGLILPQIKGRIERLRGELDAKLEAGVQEVEEEDVVEEVETLKSKIDAAIAAGNTSHATLQALALEAGLVVPDDPRAPWTFGEGDATTAATTAEKKDVLANTELPAEPEPEPEPA